MTRLLHQSPQFARSFHAHEGGTTSASFSPDSQSLATSGYDCMIRLWDIATWKEDRVLPGHRRGHVAFSPDGSVLVSGGLHKNATVYDTATWRAKRTLYGTSGVWDLTFAPGGRRLAITQPNDERDDPIELRNTQTWRIARMVGVRAVYIHAVAFHPDGERVAVAVGGQAGIWTADFTRKVAEFSAHDRATWGLGFSPDGATLATGGADNIARLWDAATWMMKNELIHEPMAADAGYRNGVLCAAFSPDGSLLVTGGLDGMLTVWGL